jgi:hypothetical protein
MKQRNFFLIFIALNLADLILTFVRLQNPLYHELNPIPFSLLLPLKLFVMPLFITRVLYSEKTAALYGDPKLRDININVILLMYVLIILNNIFVPFKS